MWITPSLFPHWLLLLLPEIPTFVMSLRIARSHLLKQKHLRTLWEISVHSAQFCPESETTLKNKVFKKTKTKDQATSGSRHDTVSSYDHWKLQAGTHPKGTSMWAWTGKTGWSTCRSPEMPGPSNRNWGFKRQAGHKVKKVALKGGGQAPKACVICFPRFPKGKPYGPRSLWASFGVHHHVLAADQEASAVLRSEITKAGGSNKGVSSRASHAQNMPFTLTPSSFLPAGKTFSCQSPSFCGIF